MNEMKNKFFLIKSVNLPNIPRQAKLKNKSRLLVKKVYEAGWVAKTEQQLID